MVTKRLLRPERLRTVPSQFSWLYHRLVRERHLERCSAEAQALYLFFVAVADAKGLSYYADASVCARLGISGEQLDAARHALIGADLIAFEPPLYQVLSLDRPATVQRPSGCRDETPVRLTDLLRNPRARTLESLGSTKIRGVNLDGVTAQGVVFGHGVGEVGGTPEGDSAAQGSAVVEGDAGIACRLVPAMLSARRRVPARIDSAATVPDYRHKSDISQQHRPVGPLSC